MSAEPRLYCIGLPVVITVTAEGEVLYEIDTSEAGSAIADTWHDDVLNVTEDEMLRDVELIEADHNRRYGHA